MNQRKFVYLALGLVVLALITYFITAKSDNSKQITAKVKKGDFPIAITTTGELVAKSSEMIYGPAALRQVQIWQVKIQDIIPDGTVVDSGDRKSVV
jgi:hypothetical protein